MISDVYDSVVDAFRRYGCPAVVYLGSQYQPQNTETLRVVLHQTIDQFASPLPSLNPIATQQYMYGAINPRPVATRRCGVEAELWATAPTQRDPQDQYRADLAYLDALVNQFVVALQQIASGLFVIEGGQAGPGNGAAGAAGLGYVVKAMIDIPVIDAPWPKEQLDRCTETWVHRPAVAEITISGKVDPEPPNFQPQPPFRVPTE